MSDDLSSGDLHRLYRTSANERSSARIDVAILQIAQAQAQRARWHKQIVWTACAAAAVLLAVVVPIEQRQRDESEALRQHYAAVTRPYLLNSHDSADAYARATRFLLERRELEPQVGADFPLQRGS
jgi:hypothetical protein